MEITHQRRNCVHSDRQLIKSKYKTRLLVFSIELTCWHNMCRSQRTKSGKKQEYFINFRQFQIRVDYTRKILQHTTRHTIRFEIYHVPISTRSFRSVQSDVIRTQLQIRSAHRARFGRCNRFD